VVWIAGARIQFGVSQLTIEAYVLSDRDLVEPNESALHISQPAIGTREVTGKLDELGCPSTREPVSLK